MRVFLWVVYYILALLMDLAFTEYFTFFNILPYSILLFLYFFTQNRNPIGSLLLSGFTGFLYDIFSPQWFGLHIIVFTTFVYVIIILKEKIFWEEYSSLFLLLGLTFLARLILDIPYYSGFLRAFVSVFTVALPGAILTFLGGIIVKFLIDAYKRREDAL